MHQAIKFLDAMALLEAMPEKNLARGEVGTVVEVVAPGVYEVEFSDDADARMQAPRRAKAS